MDDPILADGIPDLVAIARLEEDRQAVATAEIARESEGLAGGQMTFGGEGSWANQAAGVGLNGPVSDAELDRLVAFYVERGHEPKIEVPSVAHPGLHAGLAARGFVLREWEHVFVRVLEPSEDLSRPASALPTGLAVERVDVSDDAAAREWVELSLGGFHGPERPMTGSDVELGLGTARHPRSTCFVARMNGVGAGAAGVEVRGATSALFATSVVPEFRRRGIQLALMARRLEHARDHGARLACIHSRPGAATERNAMRLGFFLAYPKAVLAMPGEGLLPSP
jgi:GNAT superfamily N-acetyltransferase